MVTLALGTLLIVDNRMAKVDLLLASVDLVECRTRLPRPVELVRWAYGVLAGPLRRGD